MPEKFDFSKNEDQQKFESLPQGEVDDFVAEAHEEAGLMNAERDKNLELKDSEYIKSERVEKMFDMLVRIKEVILPDKLKEKIQSGEGLTEYEQSEFYEYFRKITENRYPSFYTASHIVGGGGAEAKWGRGGLVGRTRDGNPVYGLLNEELKEVFEEKQPLHGMCVSSGVNIYFLGHSAAGMRRPGYTSNVNKPLLIFGSHNEKFVNFVRKKYEPIIGSFSSREELMAKFHEPIIRPANTTYSGPFTGVSKGGHLKKVASLDGLQEDTLVFDQIPYSNETAEGVSIYRPESDLGIAYDIPVIDVPMDGVSVKTNIRKYHEEVRGGYNISISENAEGDETMDITYAEMIVDLAGVFDGKPKVIFFYSDKN